MGSASCVGSGSNSFVSGIDWGNTGSGWNTGATNSNNSKAPGTITDFATANTNDAAWFNGSVSGDISQIINSASLGIRNTSTWNGTNTGTGTFLPLKNIQFQQSNYQSGNATSALIGSFSVSLNLSNLQFSNTNSNSRYIVCINESMNPSTLANRFTCFVPNTNYTLAPTIATNISTPPCSGASYGTGKIIYFDYSLPSNLTVNGLNQNTCYYIQVYALNGNGYSANISNNPYSYHFFTGSISTSVQSY
jgi:hypothetical protein